MKKIIKSIPIIGENINNSRKSLTLEWIEFQKIETFELVYKILSSSLKSRALILDFDETITMPNSSSFSFAYNLLSDKWKKEFDDIHYPAYKKYKEKTLNTQWYIDWHYYPLKILENEWLDNIDLIKSKIEWNKDFIAKKWMKNFFEEAYKNNVPIVFVSAWVWNVIEAYLEHHWINYPNISIEANFIWENRLTKSNLIYWENKWEIILGRKSLELLEWKTSILHGWDSLNDLQIWDLIEQKQKLSVLFFNNQKSKHYTEINSDVIDNRADLNFLRSFVN